MALGLVLMNKSIYFVENIITIALSDAIKKNVKKLNVSAYVKHAYKCQVDQIIKNINTNMQQVSVLKSTSCRKQMLGHMNFYFIFFFIGKKLFQGGQ